MHVLIKNELIQTRIRVDHHALLGVEFRLWWPTVINLGIDFGSWGDDC